MQRPMPRSQSHLSPRRPTTTLGHPGCHPFPSAPLREAQRGPWEQGRRRAGENRVKGCRSQVEGWRTGGRHSAFGDRSRKPSNAQRFVSTSISFITTTGSPQICLFGGPNRMASNRRVFFIPQSTRAPFFMKRSEAERKYVGCGGTLHLSETYLC